MEKKSTNATIIQVLSVVMGIVGGIVIIVGFTKLDSYYGEKEAPIYIVSGITSCVMAFFAYGFGHIVEAAYRYLNITDKESADKQKATISSATQANHKLSDDERIANLKVLVGTGALTQEEFEEEVRKMGKA